MNRTLIAAAALAACGLTGCAMPAMQRAQPLQVTAQAPVAPVTHRVVIVGDSVTCASQKALEARVADIVVDCIPGRGPDTTLVVGQETTRQAITHRVADVAPGGWFVVQEDMLVTPEFVSWVKATVPANVSLAWVSADNWGADQVQVAAARAAGRGCGCAYIDWASQRESVADLTVDGLHPNAAGASVLADLVVAVTG